MAYESESEDYYDDEDDDVVDDDKGGDEFDFGSGNDNQYYDTDEIDDDDARSAYHVEDDDDDVDVDDDDYASFDVSSSSDYEEGGDDRVGIDENDHPNNSRDNDDDSWAMKVAKDKKSKPGINTGSGGIAITARKARAAKEEKGTKAKSGKKDTSSSNDKVATKAASCSTKTNRKEKIAGIANEEGGKIATSRDPPPKKTKTIEQTYQKKTQLEHILLRPDTYIGSTETVTQPMFVYDASTKRIRQREVTYTPGLYKIFDEIVVNAADNKQRDPNMDRLEVDIDANTNTVSVLNNGNGIPIVMHGEHDCYVPTLIFGQLLTGSNFDDDERKTTGGRNGYGAKLANIFSTEFVVECLDSRRGLLFRQAFRNNMHETCEPSIEKCSKAEAKRGDHTKITFRPDLKRFGMSIMDDDIIGLLSKRAYDIAGSMANKEGKKLRVFLNGNKVPVRDFKSYLELYDGITPPAAFERIDDRWEVGVGVSDGSFQQISFVNAIATTKGGGHVNYVADLIAKKLQAIVKKKNKGEAEMIKINQIKNHLAIFVNCLVENPTFDSQTKESMTIKPSTFAKSVKLSDKFMKVIEKSGVIDSIMSYAKFKQNQALKRMGGTKKTRLTGITKLDDANNAGTARSRDCTLIITEGDSAKSLAVSGLSVVGRDYYGVFPLKGKLLNVRDATHAQIMKNEEIMNLVEIMGFKFNNMYTKENIKTLRYGHLMIMADQDHDGSHIKGLIINFIHHFWPSLLDVPGFLQQFITPIVKCTKGKKSETFFTLPEYETWKESIGNTKGWNIKYYKGLGTSTSSEAKEYFSNLDIHQIHFNEISTDNVKSLDGDMIGEESADKIDTGASLIEMAFSKSKVEARKRWLSRVKKDTFLDYGKCQRINYSDFINRELVLFSQHDNVRSIPHLFDGFKPSQRKVGEVFDCLTYIAFAHLTPLRHSYRCCLLALRKNSIPRSRYV
jgi:DNA topoisomerase-2